MTHVLRYLENPSDLGSFGQTCESLKARCLVPGRWQPVQMSLRLTPHSERPSNAWFLTLLPGLAACASVLVTKYSLLAGTCVTGCLTLSDS